MDLHSTHLLVRQATRATFREIASERPGIILVRRGQKRILRGRSLVVVNQGQLALLPADEPLTIENIPATSGVYLASALVLDAGRLPAGSFERVASDDRAAAAFERAASACEDPLVPADIREHKVGEVLLWLAREGLGAPTPKAQGVVSRVRALLAREIAAEWTGPDAARALAMSEATLRRRLAAEGTAFNEILSDLRMTRALGLLQTTTLPVGRIALEVGYGCPSRFAARFRARFGIPPSAIRGRIDRIGVAIDRTGSNGGGASR